MEKIGTDANKLGRAAVVVPAATCIVFLILLASSGALARTPAVDAILFVATGVLLGATLAQVFSRLRSREK